jgi:hypothetical protein
VILETVSAVREMLLGQVALLLSLGFLAPEKHRACTIMQRYNLDPASLNRRKSRKRIPYLSLFVR